VTKSVHKKKATHEWIVVNEGPKRIELMARLFDPTYKIEHMVRILFIIIIIISLFTTNSAVSRKRFHPNFTSHRP